MKKINILFISFLANNEHFSKYKNLSIAGSNYQLGMLKALAARSDINLKVLNILPLPIFPKGKLLIQHQISNYEGIKVDEIQFINFPGLKWITIKQNLAKAISKEIKNNNPMKLISFNFYSIFGKLLFNKKYINSIKYIPILADLPIKYTNTQSFLRFLKSKIDNYILKKDLKKIDCAILLNPNAKDYIFQNANFIVIEGGFLDSDIHQVNKYTHKDKIFTYSGTLDAYSGVKQMTEAFILFSKEYKDVYLDIYGFGELADLLKKTSDIYKNIIYHGVVSKKTIIQKQNESYCLVNPKSINHPVSKVTFPSKLHEYMASGVPILSTKLSGIDDEYLSCFWLIEGDNIRDHLNGFREFHESYKYLRIHKRENTLSVIHSKSWSIQADKIIKFISN